MEERHKENIRNTMRNMWGDTTLSDWTGKDFTEKEFSAHMKIHRLLSSLQRQNIFRQDLRIGI
jgi:hypothetical protein